jgi:regulatory protein
MRRRSDNPADKPSAYNRALGLLARREHSRRELKTKLASKGYDRGESDSALETLAEGTEQSDERFGEALIRRRVAAGYGPRYIEAELRSHGIAIAEFRSQLTEVDWRELARSLISKRYGRPADRAQRDKAAQYLQRRGFPSDAIAAALGR